MAFDWSALSDEELVRALRTAPVVYGPWVMSEDRSMGTRERIGSEKGAASVMTWIFTVKGYACKGYVDHESVGPFSTIGQAVEATDNLLRSKGARLLDSMPKEGE